jgi:hypothetical protein
MDGFASVVIAHWRLSGWVGFTRLGDITDVHLLSSSGSLATLLAILRASSLVSNFAADRRPGSFSK